MLHTAKKIGKSQCQLKLRRRSAKKNPQFAGRPSNNAIYKMADILQDVRALNENPADDSVQIKGLVLSTPPSEVPAGGP